VISYQVPKQLQSNSSCSYQYLIKILLFSSILFPSSFNQIPFVPIAMEDRQVSTKVNGETCERLELSVKRNTTVHGYAKRGAIVVDERMSGLTKQKVGIFYLPSFVEVCVQICFSHNNLSHFFIHVHNPFPPLGVTSFALPTNHPIS
jgi:hypothetical protein